MSHISNLEKLQQRLPFLMFVGVKFCNPFHRNILFLKMSFFSISESESISDSLHVLKNLKQKLLQIRKIFPFDFKGHHDDTVVSGQCYDLGCINGK